MTRSPVLGPIGYPLLGAGCLLLTVLIGWSPYGQRINHIFYDLYFRQRGPQPVNANIVIAAIDDATLAESGPLPLNRERLAEVLRVIREARPAVIALDLLLPDPAAAQADLALRRAIAGDAAGLSNVPPTASIEQVPAMAARSFRDQTPVVLATALESSGDGQWLHPRPEFALSAAAVGHVHADPDDDGVSRQVLLEKQGGGKRYWALALECFRLWLWPAAQLITETDAELQVPSAGGPVPIPAARRTQRALLINYAGGNGSFPQVSVARLGKDPAAAQLLTGKIVLVGVTAQGSGDRLFTPLSSSGVPMPGVEIHAHILNTLLEGNYLHYAGESKELLGLLAVVIATLWGLARLQGLWQGVWLAAVGGFVVAAPYGRFLEGEVWPGFTLLAAFGTSLVAGEGWQLLAARRSHRESEQKRAEAQQRFAMAAHEMRTPLASIQASSELLANYPLDDVRRGQMVQLLYEESQRLGRLVERFLSVERLSAGEMELRREPVELTTLLSGLLERLRPLAERKGVELAEAAAPPPIEISADPELLEFAVSNLVTNAIKYSPAGTQVRIQWESDGRRAGIHVADSGPGLTAEESRRVFERFYRTDSAEQSGHPGYGLGLAIAREIARHHGGDIRVEARPGAGSRFSILLPVQAPSEAARTLSR